MNRPLLLALAASLLAAALLAAAWLLQPGPDAPLRPIDRPLDGAVATAAAGTFPEAEPVALRDAVQVAAAVAPRAQPVVRGRLLQDRRPLADAMVLAVSFGWDPTEIVRTTSAGDGTFSLAVGGEGCWLALQGASVPRGFRVSHVAAAPIDRDVGDVHVPLGGVVMGTVVDDAQRPVAGAQVMVVHSEPRPASPTAQLDAAPVVADEAGRFRIDRVHPGGNRVHARAGGDGGFTDVTLAAGETAEIGITLVQGQAPTAAAVRRHVLRGTVRGHAGEPTTVCIGKPDDDAFLAEIGARQLSGIAATPVVDGRFELRSWEPGEYVVVARTEGVGASKPRNVKVQDDVVIELVVEPVPVMQLTIRSENGAPIDAAEVLVRRAEYLAEGPQLVEHMVGNGALRALAAPVHDASATISIEPGRPLALAVRAPGLVAIARAFAAGAVPAQLEVVLQRAANVRGSVRGGDRVAYSSTVMLWRAEDEERMRTKRKPTMWREGVAFAPIACSVDAAGSFGIDDLAPGAYRAALSRYGLSRTSHRPDEQVGAIALVDEDVDWRTVVDVAAVGGADTHVDLVEPSLGTLRGRVLRNGQPFAGALVVAARPGWRPEAALRPEAADWDDQLQMSWAAGQRTGTDGAFTFLYRDAGDVELRVRHPSGAATSNATVVTLPAPGGDVACELVLQAGGIRGRFPVETIPPRWRSLVDIVLFPMRKAALDPVVSADWDSGVQWSCVRMELPADGRFAFDELPTGDWLVRIYESGYTLSGPGFSGRIHWQQVVAVGDGIVELGDLSPPDVVPATFEWQLPAGKRNPALPWISSVGLFRAHGDDAAAVWMHTFSLREPRGTAMIPPGDYLLAPLSWRARTGDGVPVHVGADGTVTPSLVVFAPREPKAGAPR